MGQRATVALAQLNQIAGDLSGNVQRLVLAAHRAVNAGADILLTPELSICGYPPEDLLIRSHFLEQCHEKLLDLTKQLAPYRGLYVLVGHPWKKNGKLFNALSLLYEGEILSTYCKKNLPNYGVFDERRYFEAASGEQNTIFEVAGMRFGLCICEDVWGPEAPESACQGGAQILLVANASPYDETKVEARELMARHHVAALGMATVYLNAVGGQDELLFDGASFVMDKDGQIVARCPSFEESLKLVSFEQSEPQRESLQETKDFLGDFYQGLVLALQDYVVKNHFPGIVLGLSGGIDSALVLKIAVDAVGADRVLAVMMPSKYTAQMSIDDARELANRLGVRYEVINIEPLFHQFETTLTPFFASLPKDVTEENLQARIRGTLLMALSNKSGYLVAVTGNKSEMAVGYSTLYGDLAGGFAVIKDVYKTRVYELCRYINKTSPSEVFPENILIRAPSAELREDQKDQDSLPPYEQLDQIIELFCERRYSVEKIVHQGFEKEMVKKVVAMIRRSEYKRRQSPIGPKMTQVAFGRDWRYPITNGFKG